MEKKHRHSLERHNAPFRGASLCEDSVNFDLAVLHDLHYIDRMHNGSEEKNGHLQFLDENRAALYHGEGTPFTTLATAGKIVSIQGKIDAASDLKEWTSENSATRTAEDDAFLLGASGLLLPSGFYYLLETNPGDILQLRFRLTKVTGQGTTLAFGAKDLNYDGDMLETVDLADFSSGQYIEKRLYCQSRQELKLVLYPAYQSESGTAVSVRIENFAVNKLQETEVGIVGNDAFLKPELEVQRQKINHIEERLTATKKEG